jgi:hypothetical protein
MPLTLQPKPGSPDDHLVMSGKLCVGWIYKRGAASTSQWLWAINGVQQAGRNMRIAGRTGSFEEAEAELKENWAKWLAWAKLQEISE